MREAQQTASPMFSISVYTLGCKLNQLESESLADAFRREGFSVLPWKEEGDAGSPGEEPDILLINTCTVTSRSEQKARREIRRCLREHPRSVLIVTGCYAQVEAEALEALERPAVSGEKRLFVAPGGMKDRILDLPGFLASDGGAASLRELTAAWASGLPGTGRIATGSSFRFSPVDFSFHSRAFLKIQDGCDNRCTYCRVSIARGLSRSLASEQVLSSLKALEARGYGEAVLTGVNISQYRDPAVQDLGGLLEYLLEGTDTVRLRLSSIEPEVFSPRFVRAVSAPRVRPHFHLALQSGSAAVLSRMGRRYTPEQAREDIGLLRSAREDPFLACDIIAGFPGETGEEFERTYEFCREIGFAWIHAFPFSRRPGTAAWNFKNQVSEREAGRRAALLAELAHRGRREYIRRWIGKETEAVAEAVRGVAPGFVPAVTANYLKVFVPFKGVPSPSPGRTLRCRLVREAENAAGNAEIPAKIPQRYRFDAEAEIII
jgi:threonylcarbamoyladenosine tRNA methylthiotransferase MtaB